MNSLSECRIPDTNLHADVEKKNGVEQDASAWRSTGLEQVAEVRRNMARRNLYDLYKKCKSGNLQKLQYRLAAMVAPCLGYQTHRPKVQARSMSSCAITVEWNLYSVDNLKILEKQLEFVIMST